MKDKQKEDGDMNIVGIATKIPWAKVLKGAGFVFTVAGAARGAYETDEKVQKLFKVVAAKSLEKIGKGA
jgi:hypothetical protein